ncbi:MAG: HVO_2922 family protein [Haloplanus sp.]
MSRFEVYEDAAGEWRWRLVATNGNIVADSGEGYASKSGVKRAVERIREYTPDADVSGMDGAAFEIYEDAAGEWRWRLVAANGNIIADSGQGYASKAGARDAIQSVKRNASQATVEE